MMTVKYAPNELLSITDFTKKIATILKGIKEQSCEKVGILKNNKLEAVVISTDEYERLKSLEALFKTMEHQQIFETIQARKETPLSSYLSFEELAKKFNINVKSL
jgi:PHD/YefM family antitoxin component YafN of YafNO toxin-antitoxin module